MRTIPATKLVEMILFARRGHDHLPRILLLFQPDRRLQGVHFLPRLVVEFVVQVVLVLDAFDRCAVVIIIPRRILLLRTIVAHVLVVLWRSDEGAAADIVVYRRRPLLQVIAHTHALELVAVLTLAGEGVHRVVAVVAVLLALARQVVPLLILLVVLPVVRWLLAVVLAAADEGAVAFWYS